MENSIENFTENSLAREFNFSSLLKFALPTIVMMIFTALYTIVDGIFISRFIGTGALSAVNIVFPVINIILAIAIMLATGGSAIIARKMGEGKLKEARENFTLIVVVGFVTGAVICIAGKIFIEPIVNVLGANENILKYCYDYLGTMLVFAPAMVLQLLFQTFFVAAGKPVLGLVLTVIAGVINAVFDYVFIVPMGFGITGAALATSMGYLIPSIVGIIYFMRKKGDLYFAFPKFDIKVIVESCFNGSSEMVTNISSGIITFLFNIIMMKYLGENGVAAITIVLYGQFLLSALYMGFSFGVAPVISYNHGSENIKQLKKIFKICAVFIGASSIIIFITSLVFSKSIVQVFSPIGSEVYEIAIRGYILFALSFIFSGINIFASSMFTAFSNGKVSAIISFLRTFVFIILGIILLPKALGVDGIWLAVPFAEVLTMIISLGYIKNGRKEYHYL